MNRKAALGLIAIAFAATAVQPARAAPPAASATMTCQDFMSYDEVTRPRVVYWAQGVKHKGQPREAVVDIAETERLVPIVTEQCSMAPQASFWKTLDASWMRVKADVEKHL
jgi:hypothetical protein